MFFSVSEEIQVLVPGAGLGRLAYEIAKSGYTCQGNEFSLFMLFASHFVLNKWVSWYGFIIFLNLNQFKNLEIIVLLIGLMNWWSNRCRGINSYQVHPWVHQYMNNLLAEHQTQAVYFPDVNPSDLPENAQFSMTAGDFLEVPIL